VVDGKYDIGDYDIYGGDYVSVSADPDVDERKRATFGEYIIWQATHSNGTMTLEIADMSVRPINRYTAVDNECLVFAPSIYGDVVAYEARSSSTSDLNIYLCHTSDMSHFTLTDQPDNQYLNDFPQNSCVNHRNFYIFGNIRKEYFTPRIKMAKNFY